MSADSTAKKQPVKKVRPYPLEATLKIEGGFKPGDVLVFSTTGVIARVAGLLLKVGQHVEFSAELPVMHRWVRNPVVVVKTFDRANPAGGPPERLAELHFEHLDPEHAKAIERFTRAIGQKN